MTQQPADGEALKELRRLLADRRAMEERHRKEREAIDRTIEGLTGLNTNDSPRRSRIPKGDARHMCGVQ